MSNARLHIGEILIQRVNRTHERNRITMGQDPNAFERMLHDPALKQEGIRLAQGLLGVKLGQPGQVGKAGEGTTAPLAIRPLNRTDRVFFHRPKFEELAERMEQSQADPDQQAQDMQAQDKARGEEIALNTATGEVYYSGFAKVRGKLDRTLEHSISAQVFAEASMPDAAPAPDLKAPDAPERALFHLPVSGKLSAQYESGDDGIAAIGYDRTGGTSYGKYQIASKVGSMDDFIHFLDQEKPEWAETLRGAGPANTGGRRGRMPAVWKELAASHPKEFEALQDKFIFQTHYEPAMQGVLAQTKMNLDERSPVLKEVLWSTAVQHGPAGAVRIFSKAARKAGTEDQAQFEEQLIKQVYDVRKQGFSSSSRSVRRAVKNRLNSEMGQALALLKNGLERVI